MKNNTELFAIAKKQLNKGGATFRRYTGLGGGQPWCNAFVFWLFNANGCKELFPVTGKARTYCPTSIKWCQKNLAQIPPYLAMQCDIIYFDWERNGVPNHIGLVWSRKSTSQIYTLEGNTSGGKVDDKNRDCKYVQAVFRPHFKATFKTAKLTVDGEFGYNSIAMLQKALGIGVDGVLGIATVKALQKRAGASADGAWGKGTSKAVQKMVGTKIDGEFGKNSVMALQKWINAKVFPSTTTSAQKSATTTKPSTSTNTSTKPTLLKPTATTRKIIIEKANQTCTVYGKYSDGSFKPLMSEFCSTARKGKTTPLGTWKIQGASGGRKAKYRTCKMSSGKSYAEYACRFKGGKMIHGVPYKTRNTKGYVNKTEFNKLGTPASAGCVRVPIKLAKYIYDTCPVGTPVIVKEGTKGKYPAGKPKKYTATSNVDPTA